MGFGPRQEILQGGPVSLPGSHDECSGAATEGPPLNGVELTALGGRLRIAHLFDAIVDLLDALELTLDG